MSDRLRRGDWSAIDIGSQEAPETDGTHWLWRWCEDSGLIRHDPMDWTTGTPGNAGNDTLDSGDCLADAGDSWKRRLLRVRQQQSVSICPNRRKTGGVVRQCRTAAMRDMPPKICVNLRNLRIKPFTLSRETDGQKPWTFQCQSAQMPTDYRPIRLRDFVPLS